MTTPYASKIPYSTNDPHAGAFIVYMNGIEVPVKSVTQRYGVWQIPEMSIEMVADPVLTRLGAEDRIQVAVFDLDDVVPDNSAVKPEFRLFGEGEVVAWGYQNTPSGRSISVTVVNQFAIFTQLFVQFVSNVDDMVGYYTSPTRGVADIPNITSELIFPYSLFTKGLLPPREKNAESEAAKGQNPNQINRPFDYLYNVVMACCGTAVPEAQRAIPLTSFFARWARLTNFVNRFAGSPAFDEPKPNETNPNNNIFPILKALQTASAVDVLSKNLLPQVQNAGSFYDMLTLVYQTVFMEIAMIPTMPLVTVDLNTNIVEATDFNTHKLTQITKSNKSAVAINNPNLKKPNRIQNYFPKPQLLFGLPPTCNVFFPSQIKLYQFEENYATQPTRLYFNDEVLNRVVGIEQNGVGPAIMNTLATAYPPEADAANKSKTISGARGTGKNFLLFPEEFFKGPVLDRRPIPNWLYFLEKRKEAKDDKAKTESTNEVPSGASPLDQDIYEKLKTGCPDVYRLYAEYEFWRERYSRRTGSVTLAWNPYVVPGFPMAVFDQRATRIDIFGYVTSVQQRMSHNGRSTAVSYSYGRTIQETFDMMAKTFSEYSLAYAIGPREPIREIRQVIQSFTQAELFYRKLFFGDTRLYNKDAAFDWRKVIAYAPSVASDSAEAIYITGGDELALNSLADAKENIPILIEKLNVANTNLVAKETQLKALSERLADYINQKMTAETIQVVTDQKEALEKLIVLDKSAIGILQGKLDSAKAAYTAGASLNMNRVQSNLDGSRELVPTDAAQKYFQSYDEAMKFNWRPRCTLDEYIIFYNSKGEGEVPAFNHPLSVGARYFSRIRTIKPLTDELPPAGSDGLPQTTVQRTQEGVKFYQGMAFPAGYKTKPDAVTGDTTTKSAQAPALSLPKDFPQARADWDKILIAYRNNVYWAKVPRT